MALGSSGKYYKKNEQLDAPPTILYNQSQPYLIIGEFVMKKRVLLALTQVVILSSHGAIYPSGGQNISSPASSSLYKCFKNFGLSSSVPTYTTLRYLRAEGGVYFFDENKYSFYRGKSNNGDVEVTLKNGLTAGGYIILSIPENGASFRYPPYARETLTLPLKTSFTKNDKLSKIMKKAILEKLSSKMQRNFILPNKQNLDPYSSSLSQRDRVRMDIRETKGVIKGAQACMRMGDPLIKRQGSNVKNKYFDYLTKLQEASRRQSQLNTSYNNNLRGSNFTGRYPSRPGQYNGRVSVMESPIAADNFFTDYPSCHKIPKTSPLEFYLHGNDDKAKKSPFLSPQVKELLVELANGQEFDFTSSPNSRKDLYRALMTTEIGSQALLNLLMNKKLHHIKIKTVYFPNKKTVSQVRTKFNKYRQTFYQEITYDDRMPLGLLVPSIIHDLSLALDRERIHRDINIYYKSLKEREINQQIVEIDERIKPLSRLMRTRPLHSTKVHNKWVTATEANKVRDEYHQLIDRHAELYKKQQTILDEIEKLITQTIFHGEKKAYLKIWQYFQEIKADKACKEEIHHWYAKLKGIDAVPAPADIESFVAENYVIDLSKL